MSRPQPILQAIGTAVGIGATALVALHVIPAEVASGINTNVQHILDGLGGLIVVVAPLVGAQIGRQKVTPTADPMSAGGEPLVPISHTQQVILGQPEPPSGRHADVGPAIGTGVDDLNDLDAGAASIEDDDVSDLGPAEPVAVRINTAHVNGFATVAVPTS